MPDLITKTVIDPSFKSSVMCRNTEMHILAQCLSVLQVVEPEPRLRRFLKHFSLAEHHSATYRSHLLNSSLAFTVYRNPGAFVRLKVAL